MRCSCQVRWSSSVLFAGTGGRANGIIERLAAKPLAPSFSFACITDDARHVSASHPHVLVSEQLNESDHEAEIGKMLADPSSAVFKCFSSDKPPDVAFVVSDLAETLSGSAAVLSKFFRSQGALTMGVALTPLAFGGSVITAKSRAGLRALKKHCDNVIVLDTSNLSRQEHGKEGLQGANFLELHETFLDMCAHNLSSLALPLARKDALLRISLGSYRRLFGQENGRARETRLVCSQLQVECAKGTDRGKAILQRALTDDFFPMNDVSNCFGCLVAVDAAKDLAYSEIEQCFSIEQFMSEEAIIIQGLNYRDSPGLQMTLAMVGATSAEDAELDRLEAEEATKQRWIAPLWQKFLKWF